jgi:hypothetical protein
VDSEDALHHAVHLIGGSSRRKPDRESDLGGIQREPIAGASTVRRPTPMGRICSMARQSSVRPVERTAPSGAATGPPMPSPTWPPAAPGPGQLQRQERGGSRDDSDKQRLEARAADEQQRKPAERDRRRQCPAGARPLVHFLSDRAARRRGRGRPERGWSLPRRRLRSRPSSPSTAPVPARDARAGAAR